MRSWIALMSGAVLLTLALLSVARSVLAREIDVRFKWFGSQSFLPEHDLERQRYGTPAFDDNFDLRLMLEEDRGGLSLRAAHSTTVVRGNDAGRLQSGLDRPADDDARRLADLTWKIDDGNRHQALHRLDRLAFEYRSGPWSTTFGREAVSWGNGLVFQPMDLFNPFAPTAVDRDYKPGDDLLLIERLFTGGSDLQLLAVGRRDERGDATGTEASLAAKWRGAVGTGEIETFAARHFRDRVYALALRGPLGGALWRSDVVVTELHDGGRDVSAILNVDYSLTVRGRNLYLFGEYFRNGFGVASLPIDASGYPEALRTRLARGELFSLMRDYVTVGGRTEWRASWTQELTLIGNLHDGSLLAQLQVSHESGDHQRLQFGAVHPLGQRGDEFGGVPVTGPAGTAGGASRIYVRWAYYL